MLSRAPSQRIRREMPQATHTQGTMIFAMINSLADLLWALQVVFLIAPRALHEAVRIHGCLEASATGTSSDKPAECGNQRWMPKILLTIAVTSGRWHEAFGVKSVGVAPHPYEPLPKPMRLKSQDLTPRPNRSYQGRTFACTISALC